MDNRLERVYPYLPQIGCAAALLLFAFMCVLPYVMVGVMQHALGKLHLSSPVAVLVLLGIVIGGLINYPIRRIERWQDQPVSANPYYRLLGWSPFYQRKRTETVIAVNLGGCVIPTALAAYELMYVLTGGSWVRWVLLIAVTVNIAICYLAARPIPGVGIAMPGFAAPLAAVGIARLLLFSGQYGATRAPVAFVAGVLGPLIGADLLHLKDCTKVSAGLLSIGGAGTFDGIVLSGLLAALLA